MLTPGIALARLVDDGLGEPAVHRAVPAPQDHLRGAQLLVGQPAAGLVRVVDHAVVQAQAQVEHGGVAPEVLVGQEEDPLALLEGPLQGLPGVARRADRAAVAAGERLDRGRGVHVGDRDGRLGQPELDEALPRVLDLADLGHVGHRAAGREVGQDHLLVVGGQDVGALGHEVHAAEDDELRLGVRGGLLGELERVAGDVGELDDLVALVVVAEDVGARARAPRGARRARSTRSGSEAGGQRTGALDALLGVRVGALAEQEQGQRGRLRLGPGSRVGHRGAFLVRGAPSFHTASPATPDSRPSLRVVREGLCCGGSAASGARRCQTSGS